MPAPFKTPDDRESIKLASRPIVAVIIIFGGCIVLLLALAISISVGVVYIQLGEVWQAVMHYNDTLTSHQIIHELRMPRAIAGAIVGVCFAVSGAIMQGMTRNGMADSGLLGLNAGAGLSLAIIFAFFPGTSYMSIMLCSFVGAAIGAGLVFGIGSLSKGGLTPIRLILAGAAISYLLIALSEGIAVYYNIGQDLAFWYAGGMAGIKWAQLGIVAPWVTGALLGALMLSRNITLLSLGEDVALGLGLNTRWVKTGGMLIVLVMAGAAVSLVGSVAFVGLIIPHVARYLVGVDYRWVIPCSAVLGSLLVVIADICARMIDPPYETPIGALIALLGVPYFLYLTRKQGRGL